MRSPSFEATDILEIDRTVHEPARLLLLALLSTVDGADFTFLSSTTGLTPGNLGSHLGRLEEAGFVSLTKHLEGRMPRTVAGITEDGRDALERYRKRMGTFLGEVPRS